MEIKDYITIFAVVVSLCSLAISFFTLRQKSSETERTLRNQVTDTIGKLDSVFAESDKLNYENSENKSDPYFVGRRSFLNGQRRFLARQAIYLMNHIPRLVFDFEYNRVADAFCSTGDFDEANEYYEKAIAVAQGSYHKSMCVRAYAKCLFNQGKVNEGREKYKEAVDLVKLDSDVKRFHTAETYQRWAMAEADSRIWMMVDDRIKDAEGVYRQIINEQARENGMNNLNQIKSIISTRKKKVLHNDTVPAQREIESGSHRA